MAPRKRKVNGGEEAEKPKTTAFMRVTRSAARRANSNSVELATDLLPKKKGNVVVEKKKPKAKTVKKAEVGFKTEKDAKVETDGGDGAPKSRKTIVIEHCTQCHSFKRTAMKVRDGLENAALGITVILNPVKPRRGYFEIREEDGETFISLPSMKRPFTEMKAIDMDKVIADIVDKIGK